ncbi:hypothetical protein TSACC_2313 [Terrimicrobium sacchariphilum]|uniref:Uncharacterized protein n=1 Tax=Terrimicrobium sacchariphilum TaxID=690879 RepID=A0A146G521_TERSA|nr:hypothetical protein [Terrimicrobium sacchariphilum]GAT31918.1 hypothetical protein TSACC_2313 [Terrimicrobium sacchariphilum]
MRLPIVAAAVLFFLHPPAARCQTDPKAAMRAAEANSIIIPEFKVQNVTLRSALSDLRKLSSESDPSGRGVDLILKLKSEAPFEPRLSLEVHSASMAQVLNVIASQLNMKVSYVPHGVVLTPQ